MLATRLVAVAYGVALALALAGAVATLALPAPIDAETSTAHYGRPIWFVESDLSVEGALSPREKRSAVPLNPLENPTRLDLVRFVVSYASFAAPLAGLSGSSVVDEPHAPRDTRVTVAATGPRR